MEMGRKCIQGSNICPRYDIEGIRDKWNSAVLLGTAGFLEECYFSKSKMNINYYIYSNMQDHD